MDRGTHPHGSSDPDARPFGGQSARRAGRLVIPVWLRPQRGTTIRIVLLQLTLAMLGAAVGGRLGWRHADPLPTNHQAALIAEVAFPDRNPDWINRDDELFGYRSGSYFRWTTRMIGDDDRPNGIDDYNPGFVEVDLASFQGHQWGLTQAGRRLRQAGWKVLPSPENNGVVAAKDHVTLILREIEDSQYQLILVRAQPILVVPLSAAGTLLALLGGWPLGVWLSRRIASRRDRAARFAVVAWWLGLLLLAPATLLTGTELANTHVVLPDVVSPPPIWGAYLSSDLQTTSTLGVIAMLLVVLTAIVSTRRPPRAEDITAIPAAAIAARWNQPTLELPTRPTAGPAATSEVSPPTNRPDPTDR